MPITILVDGSSRGQGKTPGVAGDAACAAVIYKNNKLVIQLVRGLGPRDNNAAEIEAVILALIFCLGSYDLLDPVIYSDSELAVKLINGTWKCNSLELLPLILTIQEIRSSFRFRVQQVPRREVAVADLLCTQYLDHLDETKLKLSEGDAFNE